LGKSSKPYHLFVISSTVMPGSTNASFIPIIEKYSGRKLNQGFGVAYDPDFVALGNVIKGFKKPDLVVIGESAPECGARVEALHHKMCENQPAISRMSIISAELAKVCLNAYITTKISFANSVANLCEKIPGADVDAITKAIGADRRISPYYFQGGLSFGGTCFPRDTRAYITIGSRSNVQVELIQAVERINIYQDQHLAEIVMREVVKGSHRSVGIMGLAFTANTPVITESPAVKLIRELIKSDLRVVAYDPLAIDSAKAILGSAMEYVHSATSLLEQAQLCVVTLRNAEFKEALENYHPDAPMTVVDCWRTLDREKLDKRIRLVALGRSED
jgi:UDPglucose 6-dehydrogenase